MSDTPDKPSWLHTLPGLITAVAALLTAVGGLIVLFRDTGGPKEASAPPPVSASNAPAPQANVQSLTGQWRDNWGTVYLVTQAGNGFTFTATGTSCKGGAFQSKGSGSISGETVQTVYESSIGSTGSCTGTISGKGSDIQASCIDTVCGRFEMVSQRQ
jgi:hypothetical protein